MRLKQKAVVHVIGLLAIWLVSPVAYSALSSANFSIPRNVISSAGKTSNSLNYAVQSVIGQTAANTTISISYTNSAGFLSITDSDGDGLSDALEATLGTDPLLVDTDNDGLSDFVEVNFDNNPNNYQVGVDTDPNNPDTDGDGLPDGSDPSPLVSEPNGDIAPLGAPDGIINAADVLIARRIVHGEITATVLELERGDVFPPGSPDGVINLQDLILIQNLVLP